MTTALAVLLLLITNVITFCRDHAAEEREIALDHTQRWSGDVTGVPKRSETRSTFRAVTRIVMVVCTVPSPSQRPGPLSKLSTFVNCTFRRVCGVPLAT